MMWIEWILREVRYRMFRILRPKFWVQTRPTCDEYSAHLEKKIKSKPQVVRVDERTVNMDGVEIWVANYPYCYGHVYGQPCGLPTARVRKMLYDYINGKESKDPWGKK